MILRVRGQTLRGPPGLSNWCPRLFGRTTFEFVAGTSISHMGYMVTDTEEFADSNTTLAILIGMT